MRCNGSNWAVYSGSWGGFRNDLWALWAGVIMRLEHHLVGGYVRYISPHIIIIIINHLPVVELTPRSKRVCTRHPDLCHATSGVLTSQPPEHAKIGMRVKTLSDRRHNKILHVNTASGANWLMSSHAFTLCVLNYMITAVLVSLFLQMKLIQINLDEQRKFTRAGLEPATSGLTCRGSTNWAI